jgi:hypothetical protein
MLFWVFAALVGYLVFLGELSLPAALVLLVIGSTVQFVSELRDAWRHH